MKMKTETDRYYVVEVRYAGGNGDAESWADFDRYEVTTEPPRNSGGDVRVRRTIHGAYASADEACEACQDILAALPTGQATIAPPWPYAAGGWRVDDAPSPDPAVCVVYRPGDRAPLTRDALRLRVFNVPGVSPGSSDVELCAAADVLADELYAAGYIVPADVICRVLQLGCY